MEPVSSLVDNDRIPQEERNIEEMNLIYREYESKCPLVITADLQEKRIVQSGNSLVATSDRLFDADPAILSRFKLITVPKSKGQGPENLNLD